MTVNRAEFGSVMTIIGYDSYENGQLTDEVNKIEVRRSVKKTNSSFNPDS